MENEFFLAGIFNVFLAFSPIIAVFLIFLFGRKMQLTERNAVLVIFLIGIICHLFFKARILNDIKSLASPTLELIENGIWYSSIPLMVSAICAASIVIFYRVNGE